MKFAKKYLVYALVALTTFGMMNGIVLADDVDSPNHKNGKHYTCIHFINEYNGKEVRNSCAPEGTSGTKSYTHTKTQETNQGRVYTLLGWYDADGNLVSSTAQIKVSYKASTEKCDDLYYYLKWEEQKAPVLVFNYIDNVSTGSGSWSNTNGNTSTYTHTFKKPEDQLHFSFIHWAIENTIYNPNDKFVYDFSGKGYNTEETITAYAWWQSSVTLNLYDGDNLLKSKEDFEKVSIDGYKPTKEGYTFAGWVDEEGNEVTEDTFYPEEVSTEKVTPKVVNLYATWKENKSNNEEPKETTKKTTKKTYPKTIIPPKTGI